MLNPTVAQKSAWKATASTFALALAVAVLGGAADFFMNTGLLQTLLDEKLWIVIPVLNFVGQWVRDYVKHASA